MPKKRAPAKSSKKKPAARLPVRPRDLPFGQAVLPPQLHERDKRRAWGLPEEPDVRGEYMVELNLMHAEGLAAAEAAFLKLFARCVPRPQRPPLRVDKLSYSCFCSFEEAQRLAAEDEKAAKQESRDRPRAHLAIYRIWPDFLVRGHIDKSVATVKGDAAFQSYDASGRGIVWAVIDSGIEQGHPHFGAAGEEHRSDHALLAPEVFHLHRSFARKTTMRGTVAVPTPLGDPDTAPPGKDRDALVAEHREAALSDEYGHGTHVAGILAGALPENAKARVLARQFAPGGEGGQAIRTVAERSVSAKRLRGVAPFARLISLRVLDENGDGRASDVIRALEYIREKLNDDPKLLRVHGVNLSVGYEFDAEMFACGQSPLCCAVNRLVQSGVVVVCAAGNTGYGTLAADQRTTRTGLTTTINDPGNASHAITVGATHRDSPHTYGVSYFSSKGPTGDGRLKPDLVAPGERVTSAATGEKLADLLRSLGEKPRRGTAYYVDDSGTSMAAPHVSGAIAAFLSIRREFIGKPLEVKRIFLESATPLGREKYFEGHGLVDLMRAIQSV
jgi:subtilisin family serine protease